MRVYQTKLQWLLYGATAARTQTHPFIHVRPPFRVVWSQAVGGLMEFPAAVDDDVAFVSNYHGSVRAYSMRDGAKIWRRDTAGKMAASPGDRGRGGRRARDGRPRLCAEPPQRPAFVWTYDTGAPIESSPLVLDGVDYFGTWNGTVYALDLRTRRARWTYRSGNKITSSAAFANGTLYIGDYGGRLLALAARDGALRWSGSVNGRIYGTPAVANGRVFVTSSTGGSLTAFSTGGSRLWSLGTGSYVYSSPAVWNGRVYFGSYNGTFYAVSAAQRRGVLALHHRGRDRRSGLDRRRRRLLQQPPAPDLRAQRAHRASRSSASPTAPSCRSRATRGACSCTASRASTRSSTSAR